MSGCFQLRVKKIAGFGKSEHHFEVTGFSHLLLLFKFKPVALLKDFFGVLC